MLRWGDERAVTVQIGAVLLFAILFSALALYQLNAVPAENEQVEYTHNQEVRDEMQDLRNVIQNVGTGGGTQSTSITLGTQYPSRTVAVNPPAARGTLETTGPQSIQIDNAAVSDDYEYERDDESVQAVTLTDELITAHNTTTIAYEPGYNEYDSAPTTRIEHGFAFNDFDDAQVSLTDQPLISNDTIRLVTLEGDLSESGSSAVSLDPTVLSGPSDEIPIRADGGSITVTIPTNSPVVWNDTVNDGEYNASAEIIDDGSGDGPGEVEVELTGETYDLQISRVNLDGSGESSDEFDVTTKSQRSGSEGATGGSLALEWDKATVDGEKRGATGNETTVSAAPNDNVTLTVSAEEYPDLQGAQSDFSFSDSHDIIVNDSFLPDPEFEDGTATVEFEIASDANADEEATVLVSSGGGLAVATITVEEQDVADQTLSIDDLTITDESGKQAEFDVDWAVSDDDGNLQTVWLSLENEAGDEVDDVEIDVDGAEASGTTELSETGNPDAQEYTITLTVSDGDTDIERTETVDYAG